MWFEFGEGRSPDMAEQRFLLKSPVEEHVVEALHRMVSRSQSCSFPLVRSP